MSAKLKRVERDLPLPNYQTKGAAGFDLSSRSRVRILPHKVAYAPLNIALKPPKGHFLLLAARSSLHKRGLMLANGVGIGDGDFLGEHDEYAAALYNFTDTPVTIERGDRIVQGLFIPVTRAMFREVKHMKEKTRGGFGSTGRR